MFQKIKITALVALVFFIASCKKEPNIAPISVPSNPASDIVFLTVLRGSNEVPANNSAALGSAILTFNPVTKRFTTTVTFLDVVATVAHIHKGAIGTNGAVVFGFSSPILSPINYTSGVLTAAQEADLLGNAYYVNVHSASFPAGELRGQLIRQ